MNVLGNISVRLSDDQWDFIPRKIQTFQMVSVSSKSTGYSGGKPFSKPICGLNLVQDTIEWVRTSYSG